ncbi:hypothetical protein ACUXA5_000430 [Corynebacterium hesseae]
MCKYSLVDTPDILYPQYRRESAVKRRMGSICNTSKPLR